MSDSATYSVVLSGKIKSGFDADTVAEAFAKLFKLPAEKASSLVGTRFVIKKQVELRVAKTYKDRLDSIGLEVALKRHGGVDALSLEPGPAPETPAEEAPDAAAPAKAAIKNAMVCPKCRLEQPRADECSGCGVFVHKLKPAADATAARAAGDSAVEPVEADEVHSIDARPSDFKLFIAPAIAAVLGALLWYLIAVTLEYEFGAVAWLIGGAIGYAAIMSGANGNATGVVCAALVVISICGGKYMTFASFQSDLAESVSTAVEFEGVDLREFYEQEINDAREFARIPGDDASLRQFLVAFEYSEYVEASEVPDEELEIFREYTQPQLEEIYSNRPSFEEWREFRLTGGIEDLSTFSLVMESLGWMDLLFLFFGIATAYRLASRGL